MSFLIKKRRRILLSLAVFLLITVTVVLAEDGDILTTPVTPMELPVEIEIELAPAASLKQAPLWQETIQLLENPYGPDGVAGTADDGMIERRDGFGVAMPDLNVWPLDYNFLTGQPMRLRTSDGGVSWDLPGPMFDPDEVVAVNAYNVPTELRTIIGALVGSDDDALDPGEVDGTTPCTTCGYLIVSNPDGDSRIPPDGTVVAAPAVVDGELQELNLVTGEFEPIEELEIPINEEDFFRPDTDTTGVRNPLRSYIGRSGAEVLGKALFWDMQVGSDGVQACGSCHFAGGADTRTQNQLNPNHLGGDTSFQIAEPNGTVVASDFPFHQLVDSDIPGEPLLNPGNVASDANDVMSSMGVRLREFVDIPPIGTNSFGPAISGVRPLLPDIGNAVADPIPGFQDLRRVEPRNTPTIFGAAFNFDNFWDGRARFIFNGGSVFGASDPQAHIFIDPGNANGGGANTLQGATNAHIRPDLLEENPDIAEQPVRIKFSSLASQAVGPPLSEFEMSFLGRNWPKLGAKLLQGRLGGNPANSNRVVPLANQLVATDDSRLGPFSNQGGSLCNALPNKWRSGTGSTAPGKPGLCITYNGLVELAFDRHYWQNRNRRLIGAPDANDPFDGYSLTITGGNSNAAVCRNDTNCFNQREANFSLLFGLSVQAYEQLTIPDDTPFDQFMDANPLAANAIGQPGEQGVLFPTLIPDLVGGSLTLIPDDPSTPEYDGFGPDEILGMDIFMGGNLTAALPPGSPRNPIVTINTGTGTQPNLIDNQIHGVRYRQMALDNNGRPVTT